MLVAEEKNMKKYLIIVIVVLIMCSVYAGEKEENENRFWPTLIKNKYVFVDYRLRDNPPVKPDNEKEVSFIESFSDKQYIIYTEA